MNPVRIHLYLASDTSVALRVAAMVREMVDTHLGGRADVVVIDVLSEPEKAEEADVLATPTIDCVLPLPKRRLVGVPPSVQALADALVLTNVPPATPAAPSRDNA